MIIFNLNMIKLVRLDIFNLYYTPKSFFVPNFKETRLLPTLLYLTVRQFPPPLRLILLETSKTLAVP